MIRKFVASILFTLIGYLPAASASIVSPAMTLGAEFGGEKIVDVVYADGSRSDIEAGRGLFLSGGVVINLSETIPHTFETQLTAGFKFTSTKQASNGEVSFNRWPIELLTFYRNTERYFRFGGGVVYQVSNELKGTNAAANATASLKNATGLVLEVDWFVGAQHDLVVGARYTAISYQAQNSSSVSGNSYGLVMTFVWPERP